MSLTLSEPQSSTFLDRFEHVRASLRRSQVVLGLLQTLLVAGAGFAALVAADFRLELPRSVRAAGLGLTGALALAAFVRGVVVPVRWWSRPRAAAEIERRFPQLGQRVRTVVQYAVLPGDRIDAEGAAPTLVDALEEETARRARALRLDEVIPRRKVLAAAGLAALPLLAIALAAASGPEWRTALRRGLLGRLGYTTLTVTPGDLRVDQGGRVRVAVALAGRPRRDAVLQARPADRPAAPWMSSPMRAARDASGPRVAELTDVRGPLAYRVTAGPETSPTYRVDVRYPLTLRAFEVGLRPPAYTGIAPGKVKGGDLHVIEGTVATFRVAFDAPPSSAALVLIDPSARARRGEPPPAPLTVALRPEGGAYVAELTLAKPATYRIDARTADGRVLPEARHQIDVQEDRPPRVSFESPDEALEVHPIAEVRHRIRIGDDFGLARAGIVVRFNDGEEQTLVARDFAPGPDGKPTTASALEAMLLLETFEATPTDSVTYYAFAEDNYPGGSRRTETDLRYIDIRPFKREYKLSEGIPGDDNGGESTTLEELIARQRFNLNRASRLARRRASDRTAPDDPLKIATFEEALAGLVREFTEGVEGIVGEPVEPLHRAEEAMLAAVDALDRGRNEQAPALMAEAVRRLIETRRTFRVGILAGGSMARAMRRFDRQQAQKIRRPKGKDAEAEQLAEELEQLAQQEDFVYATLAGLVTDDPAAPAEAAGGDGGRAEKRREATKQQEEIADRARELEEKLKRLDEASDLAKDRMAKAAAAVEKAAGGLSRGQTKDAAGAARAGALMLHEVARQVKGEVATEVADELAMARDLADELARREDEFGRAGDAPSPSGAAGTSGEGAAGGGRSGDWGKLTDAERLERLEEAARTLQEWLKGAGRNAEGDAAARVRELLAQAPVADLVDRAGRVGELYRGGREAESRREARSFGQALEVLARQLDLLHRGLVAPELARLVELERRAAELGGRLETLETAAQVAEWRRQAAALARDLEKAKLDDVATALGAVFGGPNPATWVRGPRGYLLPPDAYGAALRSVASRLHERLQALVLKDLAADRDEATPAEFRELVERYYEVLSAGGADGAK